MDVLRNGDEIFAAWLEAIRRATRSIDLLAYLWGNGAITDEIGGALVEPARAGLRVRVLLDALGSKCIDRRLLAGLRASGATVAFYRPVPTWRLTAVNARTHRRALVCDEDVAFTDGTGIDEAWTGGGRSRGDWRDTAFSEAPPSTVCAPRSPPRGCRHPTRLWVRMTAFRGRLGPVRPRSRSSVRRRSRDGTTRWWRSSHCCTVRRIASTSALPTRACRTGSSRR